MMLLGFALRMGLFLLWVSCLLYCMPVFFYVCPCDLRKLCSSCSKTNPTLLNFLKVNWNRRSGSYRAGFVEVFVQSLRLKLIYFCEGP